jgi:hypothetical protein
MKKRFSDEQIFSILREAEAGVSAREIYRKNAISDITAFGISGVQVTRILYSIALFRG